MKNADNHVCTGRVKRDLIFLLSSRKVETENYQLNKLEDREEKELSLMETPAAMTNEDCETSAHSVGRCSVVML